MSYTVRSGDTLSKIAARFHTSVSALQKKNHIRNANLIFAGQHLDVGASAPNHPSAKPSAHKPAAKHPAPKHTAAKPHASKPGSSKTTGWGSRAMSWAKSVLGKNVSYVKTHGALGAVMPDWVPNTVNCANFVSACLIKAGAIRQGQGSASVAQLATNLRRAGWKNVGLKGAKPGDVVVLHTPRSRYGHVVMFAGWKNGRPVYIGSNNINADGTQRISYSTARYPVTAVLSK